MGLSKVKPYSNIYEVDTFSEEYKKLFKNFGEYDSCKKKLMFNLSILDNASSINSALQHKNIEKLKDVDNLYSIRNPSKLNPRTIFCYEIDDNIYILLTSFFEKNTSDYNRAVKRAQNIIKSLE
jgi:hypothetical protein